MFHAGFVCAICGSRSARELAAKVAEATTQVQRFEQRYGVPFERFEAELLPALDTPQAHQDDNDWFFWHSVLGEQQALLGRG